MCLTPYPVKMNHECYVNVPCGKCPECRRRRVSAWSFRLMQEEKRSTSAHFITLTYDTSHVPISKLGFMSLSYDDAQLFFKRLRKRVSSHSPNVRIKYYLAGEYGGKTNRPHYHAIIFNVDDIFDIEKSWKMGTTHYGTVSGASIGYTLKYLDKPRRFPMHKNDDRLPERALISKGLGAGYLTKEMLDWHKADLTERMHMVTIQGQKISMPRYYKDKIYSEDEREKITEAYKQKMWAHEEWLQRKYGNDLEHIREQIILHKYEQYQQNFKKDKL